MTAECPTEMLLTSSMYMNLPLFPVLSPSSLVTILTSSRLPPPRCGCGAPWSCATWRTGCWGWDLAAGQS